MNYRPKQTNFVDTFEVLKRSEKFGKMPSLVREYSFAFPVKKTELTELLNDTINDRKMLRIGGVDHVMSVILIDGVYYAYDPEDSDGEKTFSNLSELQAYIESALFTEFDYSADTMPITLDVFDQEGSKPYPYKNRPTELVKSFLLRNNDVNRECTFKELTLNSLSFAIEWDQVGIIRTLLKEKDIDINKGSYEFSPLIEAVKYGDVEIVQILLADERLDAKDWWPALILSHSLQNSVIHDMLQEFAKKKKLDSKKDQETLILEKLMLAAIKGDVDSVKKIIEKKEVDLNKLDSTGHTVLQRAAFFGREEIVNILINERIVPNQPSALIHAASTTSDEAGKNIVNALIKAKATLDAQNMNGETAVFVAIKNGNVKTAEALIKAGADLNIPDNEGKTPLMKAIKNEDLDCIKVLLNAKERIYLNEKDKNSLTPLMAAVKTGNPKIVNEIIKTRLVDHSIRNNDDRTALMMAARYGYTEIVKLLLDANEPNLTDCWQTMMKAGINAYPDIVNLFKKTKVIDENDKWVKWMTATVLGDIDTLKLLSKDIELEKDKKDLNQKTALFYAADEGNIDVVRVLVVEAKVDINTQNKYGWTPLMLAADSEDIEMVKLLLESKANTDIKNDEGDTALQIAKDKGSENIVKVFQEVEERFKAEVEHPTVRNAPSMKAKTLMSKKPPIILSSGVKGGEKDKIGPGSEEFTPKPGHDHDPSA